ncbi:hypothetical protein LIER_09038 [Lithospermum erythrorhizon]|uniref:Integrase catalytic domain-containing protein n=1 Tax=Lithospermum erythrorhizon TaxID=34254 RepID=A0AAV3PI57_LITER
MELWHNRMGHMGEKGLKVLSKRDIIPKFEDVYVSKCTHCLMGKKHRVSFNKQAQRKSKVLELVYSDLCGPMKASMLGGCSYFVTFMDEYSRKLWAYPLRTKDQVCDNGGKYIGLFDQYCKEHGIRHEKIVPKTPQQNELAERMNRTIVEKIRCMFSHSNLPPTLWGEALCAAKHIINLLPTTILEGDVPEEVRSGRNVSYKHLRVFGCRAFVHVSKDERTKLDNKSRKCVYLSYGDDKFSHKLFDPVTKNVVGSRDVVFFEDQTIKDFDREVQVET